MYMENTKLKSRIMKQVYMTWFFNRSKPVVFLQMPLVVLFLVIEHEYVAFRALASNAVMSLNSPRSVIDYVVTAFQNTAPLEALIAVAIGLFSFLAVASIVRNIATLSDKKTQTVPVVKTIK